MERARWGIVVVALASLFVAVPASAGGRPEPRGGSEDCLTHRDRADSEWVITSLEELRAYVYAGGFPAGALRLKRGVYSITFVDGVTNHYMSLRLKGEGARAHLEAQASAAYVIEEEKIRVGIVSEDNTTITSTTSEGATSVVNLEDMVFAGGGRRFGAYTCAGSRLTIFRTGGVPVTFHRRSF